MAGRHQLESTKPEQMGGLCKALLPHLSLTPGNSLKKTTAPKGAAMMGVQMKKTNARAATKPHLKASGWVIQWH